MIWDVFYTESATKDLQGIYDYIAYDLLEPETAEDQANRILDAADSLEHMPMRHRLCDYEPWRTMGLRVIPVNNYLIFYLPDESLSSVAIIRIMYNRRDIEKNLGSQ